MRRRAYSHMSPTRSHLAPGEGEQYERVHLMPRPSPRKLMKQKDIEESPEHIRKHSMERSMVEAPAASGVQTSANDEAEKKRRRINKKILH